MTFVVAQHEHLGRRRDRKSTRLNSSHTVIYTLSLHDALPICAAPHPRRFATSPLTSQSPDCHDLRSSATRTSRPPSRSEEHTSELQSHSDLHSFPTRRSSDLCSTTPTTICDVPINFAISRLS